MSERPYNVLFLCTGNSARSVMAECILARRGGGRFVAYSAGSHPTGRINPDARALLERLGHPTGHLRSKDWTAFTEPDAPRIDLVITVCDQAAGETCPIWPGRPARAHWGVPDPAAASGAQADRRAVFETVYGLLEARIRAFLALPLDRLDGVELEARLAEIGHGRAGEAA